MAVKGLRPECLLVILQKIIDGLRKQFIIFAKTEIARCERISPIGSAQGYSPSTCAQDKNLESGIASHLPSKCFLKEIIGIGNYQNKLQISG